MSTGIVQESEMSPAEAPRIRVMGFVDGFNLYHALDRFEPAVPVKDPERYQKYKWLCLTTLLNRFVRPQSERLVGVEYFTSLPNWSGSQAKKLRHMQYISAQKIMGVNVQLGEFKPKLVRCQAMCRGEFPTVVEKQTDINIAVSLIDFADRYDKAMILTGDSDQVPTLNLLRRLHPDKKMAVLVPIGRSAKDLQKVCHESFKMTEEHLASAQLPNPIPIMKDGKQVSMIVKPTTWP